MMGAPDRALQFAAQAAEIAQTLPEAVNKNTAEATANWLRAEAQIRLNNTPAALPLIEQALQAIGMETATKLSGDILLTRGRAAKVTVETGLALTSFQKAFDIFQELGNGRSQAIALQNIGSLYNDAHQYERAISYYEQAYEVYSDDPSLDMASFNNRARAYQALGNTETSLELFESALLLAERMQSVVLQARIWSNIADVHNDANDFVAAKDATRKGLALAGEGGAKSWAPFLWGEHMRTAYLEGDIVKAKEYAPFVFANVDIATSTAAYRDLHELAYQLYKSSGDASLALQHLESFQRIEREALRVSAETEYALAAAEFDSDRQLAEIKALKFSALENEFTLAKQQSDFRSTLSFIIGGFLILIITIFASRINSMKKIKRKIQIANDNLTKSNTALQEANKAKTEFLATTSHEIRTPLNGILGMTSVMLNADTTPIEIKNQLRIIQSSGETLLSVVGDILDISKIEAGDLEIKKGDVCVNELVSEVVALWQANLQEKEVILSFVADESIGATYSSKTHLRQIIGNLVSNAAKFTEQGSIEVKSTLCKDQIEIEFTDTGVGIAPSDLERIFEPFTQADQGSNRKFAGTGLGLSISKKLSNTLGGDIRVHSTEGKGTTFTLQLPYEPVEISTPNPDSENTPENIASLRVLYVEDNHVNQLVLTALLGAKVKYLKCVEDGQLALDALEEEEFDLILMDKQMPVMDGIEATKKIRKTPSTYQDLPIIAVTSDVFVGAKQELLDAGMNDYMSKPLTQEALLEMLQKFTQQGPAQKKLSA